MHLLHSNRVPPPRHTHDAVEFAQPYGLQRYHAHQARDPLLRRKLYVGATASGLLYTGVDEHLGMFAPPRSAFAKTTHGAVANLIKHPGPAAFFTSKEHGIITATALVRSAIAGGPEGVLHTSFDGDAYPGTTEARWSLIAHAQGAYDLIEDAIRQMASVSLGDDARRSFWQESATVFIATIYTALSFMCVDGDAPWS